MASTGIGAKNQPGRRHELKRSGPIKRTRKSPSERIDGLTAKERHRQGVWDLYVPEFTDIEPWEVCWWGRENPDHAEECRGELQSCHIISVQALGQIYGSALHRSQAGGYSDPILEVDLYWLIADPRNGVPGGEVCHGRNEGRVLHLPHYPEAFFGFLDEFGLGYVFEGTGERR